MRLTTATTSRTSTRISTWTSSSWRRPLGFAAWPGTLRRSFEPRACRMAGRRRRPRCWSGCCARFRHGSQSRRAGGAHFSCLAGSSCWASTPITRAGAACCARSSADFACLPRPEATASWGCWMWTGRRAEFPIGGPAPHGAPWAAYPAAVAARMAQGFPGACQGADMAFASDLPRAAGMSSSSALVVASFLAFDHEMRAGRAVGARGDLASYLAAAETGVGTHGGSEDHTAILCCRAGRWSQFRFLPLRHEASVPAPRSLALVIGVSGVVAAKAGGAQAQYNRSARMMAAARAGEASGEFTSAELATRREQFELESEVLIPAAVAAAERGNWLDFAACVARSQAAADRALGNQVSETRALVAMALEQGAVAASAFGAGFGGAVWALVPTAERQGFRRRWQGAYRAQFAERAPASVF